MTKSELIQALAAENPNMHLSDIERVVNCVFEEISSALGRGDRVELRGFGSFSVRVRDARMGRNPRTGEQVAVPPKKAPFFKAGKEFRAKLN